MGTSPLPLHVELFIDSEAADRLNSKYTGTCIKKTGAFSPVSEELIAVFLNISLEGIFS